MNESVITLDVRDDIRQGHEPFARIMQAVASLDDGGALLLIAPFNPVPLLGVMERRGFTHQARPFGAGDWEVRFERTPAPAPAAGPSQTPAQPARVLDMDARGLEPPQPMVLILEHLAAMPEGCTLRAHTDRRPMHLYDLLAERGYAGETEEQDDGSYLTTIRAV